MSNLTADQQVHATVNFVDHHGNAVTAPAGVPVWSVDHPELLTVTPAADGLSAELVTVGPVGVAVVTVALDGVSGTETVDVVPGTVASISVVLDTPANKA